jgi:hypothetical protein
MSVEHYLPLLPEVLAFRGIARLQGINRFPIIDISLSGNRVTNASLPIPAEKKENILSTSRTLSRHLRIRQ